MYVGGRAGRYTLRRMRSNASSWDGSVHVRVEVEVVGEGVRILLSERASETFLAMSCMPGIYDAAAH